MFNYSTQIHRTLENLVSRAQAVRHVFQAEMGIRIHGVRQGRFFQPLGRAPTRCRKKQFLANARNFIHKSLLGFYVFHFSCVPPHEKWNARKNGLFGHLGARMLKNLLAAKVLSFQYKMADFIQEMRFLRFPAYGPYARSPAHVPAHNARLPPQAASLPFARPKWMRGRTYPRRAHPSPSPKGAGRRVAQPGGKRSAADQDKASTAPKGLAQPYMSPEGAIEGRILLPRIKNRIFNRIKRSLEGVKSTIIQDILIANQFSLPF